MGGTNWSSGVYHGKSGSKTLKRAGWEHKMSGFRSGNGLWRTRMGGGGVCDSNDLNLRRSHPIVTTGGATILY